MNEKTKKIKRKKKKRTTRKKTLLPRRVVVMIMAAALAMFVCTLSVFYILLGHYDGLGLRHPVPEHEYDFHSGLHEKNGRLYYEDENFKSAAGIDVSFYQEEIDWDRVSKDGIDFAMVRMGYRGHERGKLTKDVRFKENIKGARRAGLDVGVYFFSQAVTAEEAIEEARYVVRHIKGKGITYPVVFDMEPIPSADRIDELSVSEKTEIADAFCQVIERNGYEPMVYGNPQWLSSHLDLSFLTKYPVWLAHYTDYEATNYPYTFSMWQYTDKGHVDGISGNVDLNIHFIRK